MKIITLFFISILLFSACGSTSHDQWEINYPEHFTTVKNLELEEKLNSYQGLRDRVKLKQDAFKLDYSKADDAHKQGLIALSRKYLYTTLTDSIFPYWYNTDWDYYGTTETPGKGSIACGYFVTTTLKHCGFNINRVKLAQQASSVLIKTICGKGKTKIIGHNNTTALKEYLLQQKDGLFIIGLDNHVGFIQKDGTELFAIHSNGISSCDKVIKEPLADCKLINSSQAFYVGNIFANEDILIKWIKQEKIDMVN